ncbi:hypothetical protein FOL46_008626 [Perkinsus olseni]|uniref:RNA-editing substrate-binding complex 6 protein domain-containing protein n=1 Tax=Perkinsus olseni TaxID=32597 RepID=A0A7J6MM28_PEROL|nr:hypothetical protein FOL46_008626 [Perkinsus olseni]
MGPPTKMMQRARVATLLDGFAASSPGDSISKMAPWTLTRYALRNLRESRKDAKVWKAIAERAKQIVPMMQPSDMSVICFSLARLRLRDRELLSRVAQEYPTQMGRFSPADLAYLLSSYARLEMRHDLLFNIAAREAARLMHRCNSRQVSDIMFAFASLQYVHPRLFNVIRRRVVEVAPNMEGWHLALTCSAFAKLQLADTKLFAVLAGEICKRISDLPPKSLALVANSYARLNVHNRFLLEVLMDESFRHRGKFSPQGVALMLNSYAKLKHPNPLLFDYFAKEIPKHIKKYTLQSVMLVASSYARAGHKSPALFAALGDQVSREAENMTPRIAASLVHSFSVADVRNGPLLYHTPELIEKNITTVTLAEIFMVLRAYAKLNINNLELIDTTLARIPHLIAIQDSIPREGGMDETPSALDDYSVSVADEVDPTRDRCEMLPLLGIIHAMSMLHVSPKGNDVYKAAVDSICEHASSRDDEEFTPVEVASALEAMSNLHYRHNGLLGKLRHLLSRESFVAAANDEDAQKIMESLRAMGWQDRDATTLSAGDDHSEDHEHVVTEFPMYSEDNSHRGPTEQDVSENGF